MRRDQAGRRGLLQNVCTGTSEIRLRADLHVSARVTPIPSKWAELLRRLTGEAAAQPAPLNALGLPRADILPVADADCAFVLAGKVAY